MAWLGENIKGPNTNTTNNSTDKRKKTTPHEWRPPIRDEKNKRIIHNKPYTWSGNKSWIKDDTPDSGLESPDISPSASTIAITGQKNAAAAIAATAKAAKATGFRTTVKDDATPLNTETSLTQDQVSEINRIQVNLLNFGTSVSDMTAYLSGLHTKE